MPFSAIHSFDVLLVLLPLLGSVWGWFNGGLRSAVKLLFIFAPSVLLGYFADQILSIGQIIGDMLVDRTTMPLGVIGSMAGILAMMAMVALSYLVSQLVLNMLHLNKPGTWDHYIGIALGAFGVLSASMVALIFSFVAFPNRTFEQVEGAFFWPYSRPVIAYSYPQIGGFIETRMSTLVNGLSDNGVLARIAAGGDAFLSAETLDNLVSKIKQLDVAEVLKLQKAAAQLDPDKAREMVNSYRSGALSEQRLRAHLNNPHLKGLNDPADLP